MSISLVGLGIPADIAATIQDNMLLRKFYDGLFPRLLYRADMTPELWQANLGEHLIMTRTGLIEPKVKPLVPGQDVKPSSYSVEQWEAFADQYGDSVDTNMPTSYVSMASTHLRNVHTLGLNAGQSINRVARNSMFRAYLGGEAMVLGTFGAGATEIVVSTLNGFTQAVQLGRFAAASSGNPLAISFTNAEPPNTVIGFQPADPSQPFGPGILTLGAALSSGVIARVGVLAVTRSRRQRSGGASTIDGISPANTLTLDDCIATVARLRDVNVPPHDDGYYHAHITPAGEKQIFGDNHWQRLHQSLPDSTPYKDFLIDRQVGIAFYRNTESPSRSTVGELDATGTYALLAPEIGGEVVNETGLPIARMIVTGAGVGYEKYIDESRFISEAGVQGKIGQFAVVNGGVQVMTERIRLIMRAPQDRLQQNVSTSWSWSGDFPIPSDALTGDPARYKRAIVVEHCGTL